MGDEIFAWERQPSENDEAWEAFRSYRDQTPPRRTRHAAVKRSEKIVEWYNTHAWAERCAAYDRHLDDMRRKTREELLAEDEKERAAHQLGQLKMCQDIIDNELAKLWRDTKASEAFGTMKVNELTKLLEKAITLERLIRGQTTENIGAADGDLANLTPEELRQMRALQQKMNGKSRTEE